MSSGLSPVCELATLGELDVCAWPSTGLSDAPLELAALDWLSLRWAGWWPCSGVNGNWSCPKNAESSGVCGSGALPNAEKSGVLEEYEVALVGKGRSESVGSLENWSADGSTAIAASNSTSKSIGNAKSNGACARSPCFADPVWPSPPCIAA
jgi:hypothetical protein